jgi:hypothetical protein
MVYLGRKVYLNRNVKRFIETNKGIETERFIEDNIESRKEDQHNPSIKP